MTKIVQHIWEAIRQENTDQLVPVFDNQFPIRSTGDMRTWYTGKPCEWAKRSHINFAVYDSTWEASEAFILDHDENVDAWVKNDHLGFEILYVFKGVVKKYRPDFIIRLKNGKMLVLGGQGPGHPAGPIEADLPGRVVQGGQYPGRFRGLGMGCVLRAVGSARSTTKTQWQLSNSASVCHATRR